MISKELVFYLPQIYSYQKWISLNPKIDKICRGHGVTARTVKEKKLRRQTITIDCPSEVAFLNTVSEVAVLMEKNGIEETLISHRNLNVCELIDMLETA